MDAARTAERVARTAYGRLLAVLVRRTRDVAAAEDALAHAFAQALATWPRRGIPNNPEGWLSVVARNTLRDAARRAALSDAAVATLALLAEERAVGTAPDERLGLLFAASHPAISAEVHAPLILQVVFGVTAQEMAPAFLVPAATIGQRLARAKAKIKLSGITFEPDPCDVPERIGRALGAVYALYTIAAAAPPTPAAAERASDALHLARLMAELAADDPEPAGLAALIAFREARKGAARDADGRFVPLSRQDASAWDMRLIGEAEARLARAATFARIGPYQLEAAIQSVHCDRARTGATRWGAIATFYDALVALAPTVGAEVARAAALAEAEGAHAGLAALARIPAAKVEHYQPYWAVRAHLERRVGAGGADAYRRAIGLAADASVRAHLAALAAGASHT